MKIPNKETSTDLITSPFMRRALRLSQKNRYFLMDMMEQTRKIYEEISANPLYQRYPSTYHHWEKDGILKRQKRELNLALQMGTVAMWMVLDNSRKRNQEGIGLRLREIDRLVMHHGLGDVYEAVTVRIGGSIFDETVVYSFEEFPKDKREEYETRMKEYIFSNLARRQFIDKMMHPYVRQQTRRPRSGGRQRES